jgi:NRAMP (natural resistance-associated macrophage protein)-like metal ion transporter
MTKRKIILFKVKRFWSKLGPGLITGASDDDPSGIATYSQAGVKFGLSFLWTAIITYPLMISIQKMCARIGLVTSQGLTGILKRNYPKSILWLMVLFSFPAIILNIGADLAGMGAVANMLIPQVPAFAFSFIFTILIIVLVIRLSYYKIAAALKWLCLVLFCYLIVPFLSKPNFKDIIANTFIPRFRFDKDFLLSLVGILGTTISPYLFFWQASMEVEEMKHKKRHLVIDKRIIHDMEVDVDSGIFFSNMVFYFIILTTGSVLFYAHVNQIDTVEQAALALRPLAGELSCGLFAIGIIGTGFLAVPVLAGSLSYIISETFNWEEGLDKKFHQARGFYFVLIFSMGIAFLINFIGFSPVQALIYTAVLYGITAPILIAIILHICNNKKIMGDYTNDWLSNFLGLITLILMTAAAVVLIYLQFKTK